MYISTMFCNFKNKVQTKILVDATRKPELLTSYSELIILLPKSQTVFSQLLSCTTKHLLLCYGEKEVGVVCSPPGGEPPTLPKISVQ